MKKDIPFPSVENVFVAIVKESEESWKVYLINRNAAKLENVMVTSRGYGEAEGEEKSTSILRHAIPSLDPGEYALIEPIIPNLFKLTNEYWVSFFINKQVYDKKFIFVPDSVSEMNLSYIPEVKMQGIMQQ